MSAPESHRRTTVIVVALMLALIGFMLWRARSSPSRWTPAASSATADADTAPPRSSRRSTRFGAGRRQAVALAEAERLDTPGAIGPLEGTVLSRADRRPVAGARLTFAAGDLHEVVSDASGRFSFRPSREGVFELALVTADGYLPFAPEWGHSPLLFVARRGSGLTGARVILTPAIDYRVKVLSPEDEPVAGARVRILEGPPEGATLTDDAPVETVTAEDGTTVVHAQDYALLEARHPSYSPGRAQLAFGAQVSHELTIRLGPPGAEVESATLTGKVLDPDGTPSAEALVIARHVSTNRTDPQALLVPNRRALSEDDGRFELSGLDPGRYDVVASVPGYAPAVLRGVAVPGRAIELRLGRGATLFGHVRDDASGAPVASFALVVLQRQGPIAKDVVTVEPTFDAEGAYEIGPLPPGSYLVSVSAQGFADAGEREVTLVEGEPQQLDFRLGRGGRVRGQVLDAESGEPLAGAKISVEGTQGQGDATVALLSFATSDDRGRFELGGINPGRQSLFIAASGHHGRLVGIAVASGEIQEVTVELTPTAEGEEPRIELAGIGAVLSAKDDALVIGRVIEGGGAEEAGLGPGDAIVRVDGATVVELGFGGAIHAIRGPEGSTVTLSLRRGEETLTVVVTRRRIRS